MKSHTVANTVFHATRTAVCFLLVSGSALAQMAPPADPAPAPAPAPPVSIPAPVSVPTIMSCVGGPVYQCSGNSIIRIDNGIALTSSGVQAYGRSTNDLANPIVNTTAATGLAPASGGFAEIRMAKDANGTLSDPALLLNNLGLSWDGRTERPLIIETFATTQGRSQLMQDGRIVTVPLPATADLAFFDVATKGPAGTQAHYANNRYFPRTEPVRCPAGQVCSLVESAGLQFKPGDWRARGAILDTSHATRLHSDGDARAGAGFVAQNGQVTPFPGSNGLGLPFPGTKGYRDLSTWNLQYGNLATWVTQDTVQIAEWGGSNEHNKNRRGIVAFGDVTDPAAVPASGAASYSGFAYGWYAGNGTDEPTTFRGSAVINVNFDTRQAEVTLTDTVADIPAATPVPAAFKATAALGAPAGNVANYLTGPINTGTLTGGLGGRYFGPVVTAGTSGIGPVEIGGTFQLANATAGTTVIGGFIGRKQ